MSSLTVFTLGLMVYVESIADYVVHPTYYDTSGPTLHYKQDDINDHQVTSDWSTNVPFWPHYPSRTVQVLDGNWYYGYGGDKYDINKTISPSDFAALTPNITSVPSAWDVKLPGVLGPRGTSFYRAYFDSKQGQDIQVYMAACAFYCQLYFDGKYVADHKAGGYQPFWFHITQDMMNKTSTNHELFIVSDNRYNFYSAPTYTGGDFYSFGGLNRNVLVHTLNLPNPVNNSLLRIESFPIDIVKSTIKVNITFTYTFSKNEYKYFQFTFDGGNKIAMNASVMKAAQSAVFTDVVVPNAKLWSLEDPNLHTLLVEYINEKDGNKVLDSIEIRFGLRILGIDSKSTRITLNGEIVKFYGFNRHTMYGETGSALTYSQIKQDISLIKQVGANYIRGAHYPQDQRYLDLCDENGIAIWSETLGPGVKTADLKKPYFMQYQIQAVNEMLDAAINNPSVVWWAFYNEGPSNDKNAIPGYNASASAIRARDKSRYVTWASSKTEEDVCIPAVPADIASFNGYPAWYSNLYNISDCYTTWEKHATFVKNTWPGTPFIISETGAGGIYEYDNATACKWSQLYESMVVYADASFALNSSFTSGITLWQFGDIKGNDGATTKCGQCDYYPGETICAYIDENCSRPGGENHKGSLDYWRRYKQSFNTVQQLYRNYKP